MFQLAGQQWLKRARSVPIKGSQDKRIITATFAVTLSGTFLLMQSIYAGLTKKSLPRFKFPKSFSLSANKTHYSNEKEALKYLREVIIPYVKTAKKSKKLSESQKALLIFDVFKGLTDPVIQLIEEEHLVATTVPNNMTDLFQVNDLSVNKYNKCFMKRKFNTWYSNQIMQQMDAGRSVTEIDVKLLLSTLKPLHAGWMVEFYNRMTTSKGKEVIMSGWRAAGISEALSKGKQIIEKSLNPFKDIDPTIDFGELDTNLKALCNIDREELQNHRSNKDDESDACSDDDDDEWHLNEESSSRSAFDVFDDEESVDEEEDSRDESV